LCQLFEHQNKFKWTLFELWSRRTHRDTKFLCRVYLHPNLYENIIFFLMIWCGQDKISSNVDYEHRNDFKWQKYELQSFSSQQKLQFSYNFYLDLRWIWKKYVFLKNMLPGEETFVSIIWVSKWLKLRKVWTTKL
jgi:hypothetical protein